MQTPYRHDSDEYLYISEPEDRPAMAGVLVASVFGLVAWGGLALAASYVLRAL